MSTQRTLSPRCVARMHLRGADFAVYDAAMALTAHSTSKRILSASKATRARMTGYSERTVGFSRGRLVAVGWFLPLRNDWKADQRRTGAAGAFRTPEFEVIDHQYWARLNPGKCSTVYPSSVHGPIAYSESEHAPSAHAETADTVHGPTTDTVHGQHVHKALQTLSLKEKPARKKRGHFENRKMTDGRFTTIRDFYIAEFERRNPGVKARFDGRDGKALADLLTAQKSATAEIITGWLRNAMESDVTYPLQANFRMHKFCAHFENFLNGPLRKRAGGPTPIRSAKSDPAEADRLDSLVS
jgi:hypothetical protein